jgi:hypothetical protein
MNVVAVMAPVFSVFEVAQLVLAHRYIGPAQIRLKLHPLDVSVTPPPFWLSLGWMAGLWADYVFQVLLFFEPNNLVRIAALLMMAVSLIGFTLRRACGLPWGLVIMTIEGSLRAGFMFFAFRMLVFPPHWRM